jgi:DNA-binding CsgD family transcriptional regulator
MKKLYQSLLLIIAFVLNSFAQEIGLPFSKYYSSKEYQGGIQNFSIGQDENGLIYAANNFGLLEYDGSSWNRYGIPNSTKIRDLLTDNNGRIYIAGQGQFGYFQPNDKGILEFVSWIPQLPQHYQDIGEVWKIFKIHGDIVFCTFKNIFIFSQSGSLIDIVETGGDLDSFHLSNNQLYFQDSEKGLMKLENNSALLLSDNQRLKSDLIIGILENDSGGLKIFSSNGDVFHLSDQKLSVWRPSSLPKLNKVNKAVRLRNGKIAIGTQYDGFYILKENGAVDLHMNLEKGLNNNTVISIFEDSGGNLWLGHNNGITLLEMSLPFRLLGPQIGIFGTGYMAKLFNEAIYLGTNVEVFKITEKGEKLTKIPFSEGQTYSFSQIENKLLLGHNEGAFEVTDVKAEYLTGIKGVWGFLPLRDGSGLILAGTYKGLALFQEIDGKIAFVRKLKGFEESSRLIQQDESGNIWMSHGYKGIYKLTISDDFTSISPKFYGNSEGLPTNLLNSVWKIGGRIIFTTEYGIYTYNQATDKFERDQILNPYFDHDLLITSIVEDPIGNIFYIGNKEVGLLEKQADGTYQKINQIFNKIIPLLNDDLQNVSLIKSNEVLFAANEGFIWYKHDFNKIQPPFYPAFIKAVYLTRPADSLIVLGKNSALMEKNFGLKTNGSGLVLPYGQADIRFEFTNSIPNNENNTLFRFWLDGLDNEYGEWTQKRDKAFTNLREGSYIFYLQSKDIYGQVAEAIPFTFTVLPPWYRSTFAWLFYLFTTFVFMLILIKKVDKLYQKKAQAISAEQKKELEQKSIDLKASQKELEKLKTEKLEAQIQNKNRELATSTMHLLNKNGFIDQTKNQLSQIIKKSKNQEVKLELQKVIKSIDKNISEDDDWKQFEMHFDQVHGGFMDRFQKKFPTLSPQEIRLTAYLRMNLSSKEIAFLMNISPRGVEISRYRLRKKLQLERNENLQEFILKF